MQIANLLELGIPLVATQADLTPAQRVMLVEAFNALRAEQQKESKAKASNKNSDGHNSLGDVKQKLKARKSG